jgi:hypothetical protein
MIYTTEVASGVMIYQVYDDRFSHSSNNKVIRTCRSGGLR